MHGSIDGLPIISRDFMKLSLKRLSLAIAGAGMLTIYGCGGGGGGSTVNGDTPAASMTVTPSLGRFSSGTQVALKKLDASSLSTGTIGTDGKAMLSLAGYTGPVVVEVLGGTGVTYYDEGTKSLQAFGVGKKLRAVVPAALTEVGVTALTNAATAKLESAVGGIAGASADTIKTANNKVAAVFGLSDILLAPKPVDGSTGNTLNLATPGDKYALILAALAKTAPVGAQAADVADALANDLKDDKLDGLDSTSSTPTAAIANAPAATTLAAKYQEAVTDLADASSKLLAPLQPLAVTTDVTKFTVVSNQSDVNLARAMFAELRTTLNSFANGNQTGFLDTQATRLDADLKANVAPEMAKVAGRISALSTTMTAFEDAKAYTTPNNFGYASGTVPITGGTALVRLNGSPQAVWNGTGSFDKCWTDSISAATITSKVTCAHAGSDSADYANGRIKMVVFALTGTANHQYTYTATRYNMPVTFPSGVFTLGNLTIANVSPGIPVPAGQGSVSKTLDAGGVTMTSLALNGTLPPSASSATGTLATGVDTVAIAAARTAPTTTNFHYALSGSVSTTNLADSTKVVSLSLDTGSYFDLDESNATTGPKLLAAKLIGTAKTTASTFTGTVELSAFSADKNGNNYQPTHASFTGSISDTAQALTGTLVADVTDYANYDPFALNAYMKTSLTFTGTVQAPSRPLLKLVVAASKTGLSTGEVTLNYSYGAKSITGSGAVDDTIPANNTMTLSNQDGIVLVISNGATATVTKSGASLATISNGAVNYVDGVTESLN
jgi:hypothetical protein